MSYTVQNLVNEALQYIGVLADGETPSPTASAIGLTSLNELTASWDLERLNIYSIAEATYALTASQQQYTIGQGGGANFNVPRPLSIRSASIISAAGHVYSLKQIPAEEFNSIAERSAAGAIPRVIYNDNNYPNATLWLWPVPNTTVTLELFTWNPLASFALLTTTFDMPPGYQRALVHALALELAPKFQRPLDPTLAAIAMQSREALRGLNAPPVQGAAEEIQAAGAAQPIPPGANLAQPK